MRRTASAAVTQEFKAWLDAERGQLLPKRPIGEAIGYALGQWDALTLFHTDQHRIDELLPHDWTPPRPEPST